MTAIEKVEAALEIARLRLSSHQDLDMYASIVRQLEYMQRALSGVEDTSRMKDIIVGIYAAREIEDSDPEFANVLYAASEIANKLSRGLNV